MAAGRRPLGVIWAAYLLAPNKELGLAAIQPGAKRTGQATAWPDGGVSRNAPEGPPGSTARFFVKRVFFALVR